MKVSKLLVLGMLLVALCMVVPAMAADVALSKGVTPASPNIYRLGDTIHYTMRVTNNSGSEQVVVEAISDILPDGTTVYPTGPSLPYTLNPGAFQGYTWDWIVTVTGVVNNRFFASGYQISTIHDPFDYSIDKGSLIIAPGTLVGISATPPGPLSPGQTVDLTVTEQNTGTSPLTAVQVVVNNGSSDIATLVAPPTSGDTGNDGILGLGETWTWNATTIAALDNIVINANTTFTATGDGIDLSGRHVTYPGFAGEQDAVTVELFEPDTDVDISADPAGPVAAGATVDLTVTEENTGNEALTGVQVVVNDGSSDIATLVAPPTSGDTGNDGILGLGETWTWNATTIAALDNIVINATTTFTATGDALDGASNHITFSTGYLDEKASVTVEVIGEAFCTFTQGFWGNAGGQKCDPKKTTTELLVDLLDAANASSAGTDPVIVGILGVRSITFDTADCILLRLPAGGTPSALPAGNPIDKNCASLPGNLVKKNNPTINNVLVGQVVTLTLNLRLYAYGCTADVDDLAGWVLPDEFCTIGENGCPEKFTIPELLQGSTVAQLLALANQALAGQDISPITIGDIYDGVTAINEGFDECREVVDCGPGVEICLNGCDDDFDGTVDELDCVVP
jgi:uncharacterized repeat protein (TIGR01451 family)